MLEFTETQFPREANVRRITRWIRSYIYESASQGFPKAVVGVSGGKDSSVVAALCVRALGPDNVILVSMPDGPSKKVDDEDIQTLSEFLDVPVYTIDIHRILDSIYSGIEDQFGKHPNNTCQFNTPARIRMSILYAIANTFHARVANTSNWSESYVGWDTKWGDQCGDFSPLGSYTASEVVAIGRALGLPDRLIDRSPADGMRPGTDEDAWGFTYDQLDKYLLNIDPIPSSVADAIEEMHTRSAHKYAGVKLPSLDNGTILDYSCS